MDIKKGINTIQFTKDKEGIVSIGMPRIARLEDMEKDKGVKVVLVGAGNPYKDMVLHTLLDSGFVGKVCIVGDIGHESMPSVTLEDERAKSIKEYRDREPIEFVIKPRIDMSELDIIDILIRQDSRQEPKKKGAEKNNGYEKKQRDIRNTNQKSSQNKYKTNIKRYSHRKK